VITGDASDDVKFRNQTEKGKNRKQNEKKSKDREKSLIEE
jgi:hypothetical protein